MAKRINSVEDVPENVVYFTMHPSAGCIRAYCIRSGTALARTIRSYEIDYLLSIDNPCILDIELFRTLFVSTLDAVRRISIAPVNTSMPDWKEQAAKARLTYENNLRNDVYWMGE